MMEGAEVLPCLKLRWVWEPDERGQVVLLAYLAEERKIALVVNAN